MASRIETAIDALIPIVSTIATGAIVEKDLFPILERENFSSLKIILSPSDQTVELQSRMQAESVSEVDLTIGKNTVSKSEIGELLELRERLQDGILKAKVGGLVVTEIQTLGSNTIINQGLQTSKNLFVTTLKIMLKGIVNV